MAKSRGIARFKPEARPVTMTGAQLIGPTARGPLAIGALAVGAAAIGGFAIGDGGSLFERDEVVRPSREDHLDVLDLLEQFLEA